MRSVIAASVWCTLSLAACERANPRPEPHQAMMPPGAPPMPHADGAMEHAMEMIAPPADASVATH